MSNMVEVKIAELIGPALDWAVATVEAMPVKHDPMGFGRTENGGFWVWGDSISGPMLKIGSSSKLGYSPSTNWVQGGQLIDKYQLTVSSPKSPVHRNGGPLNGWNESGSWTACTWEKGVTGKRAVAWDKESPLVAACRAIVSAKLGDVVQVPAELAG